MFQKYRALFNYFDALPGGPDELFSPVQLDQLLRTLEAVRATAKAA